jgi:hypothetical protein
MLREPELMAQEAQGENAAGFGNNGGTGVVKVWNWLTKSRYTRALEDEASRLRADNGKLMSLLLGAGSVIRAPAAARIVLPQADEKTSGMASAAKPVPPTRRRSWQQIGRMLELEVSRMLAQKRGGVGIRPAQDAFSDAGKGNNGQENGASLDGKNE